MVVILNWRYWKIHDDVTYEKLGIHMFCYRNCRISVSVYNYPLVLSPTSVKLYVSFCVTFKVSGLCVSGMKNLVLLIRYISKALHSLAEYHYAHQMYIHPWKHSDVNYPANNKNIFFARTNIENEQVNTLQSIITDTQTSPAAMYTHNLCCKSQMDALFQERLVDWPLVITYDSTHSCGNVYAHYSRNKTDT
jgi:hypothetical protein